MRQRLFFVLTLMTMLPMVIVAQNLQWQPTNGPWGGPVNGFIAKDSVVLAWAETGTYRSTNNGDSWQEVGESVGMFVIGDSLIFGIGNGGIYRSSDDGKTWIVVASGYYTTIAANGSIVIAQGESMLRSINDGNSWDTISGNNFSGKYVQAMSITPTSVIAGTDSGMYRSTDTGNTWFEVSGITKDSGIQIMVHGPHAIYAAGGANVQSNYILSQYIFVSTDDGLTWTYANAIEAHPGISSLMAIDSTLYAIDVSEFVYVSKDFGVSWTQIQPPPACGNISSVYETRSTIFLASESGGVRRSTDGGINWILKNSDIYAYYVSSLTNNGNNLLVGTSSSGVYRSQDGGRSWMTQDSGLEDNPDYPELYDQLMLNCASGLYLVAQGGLGTYIFHSTDTGNSWDTTSATVYQTVLSLAAVDDTIYEGSYNGAQFSTDNGNTWTNCTQLPNNFGIVDWLEMGDGVVYATSNKELYRSFDRGSTWTRIDTGTVAGAIGIYAHGSTIYATINSLHISGTLFRSNDYGTSWHQFTALPDAIGSVVVVGTTFIVRTESGIYTSTDEGVTWSPQNDGLIDSTEVTSILLVGSQLFASTANRGVFVSDFSTSSVASAEINPALELEIFPNPLQNKSNINYNLKIDGLVSITILDPLGRIVAKPLDGEFQNAGQHEIPLDASKLTPGIYLCRLSAGGVEQETKFVVER